MPSVAACCAFACALAVAAATGADPTVIPPRSSADILAASAAVDWRLPDPQDTLQLELASGRVVIELASAFAPRHVANIKALVREGYFDGLAIIRAQDNYVVQWGDPEGKREIKKGQRSLAAEFARPLADLPFFKLPDGDVYAPEAGLSAGLPAARDPATNMAWLAHCYGMVGAGRDMAADSGGGSELYVVIGHAPRHLDRNVTLVGRVLKGMELLSTLPRGTEALGFYAKPEQHVPIRSIRVAADLEPAAREPLEVLRTDTPTFAAYLDARRTRRDTWFLEPVGRIELCNLPVPVRPRVATPQ